MTAATEQHEKEIQDLIAAHQDKVASLEGRDLLAARRQLSADIAAACERHRKELNIPAVTDEHA